LLVKKNLTFMRNSHKLSAIIALLIIGICMSGVSAKICKAIHIGSDTRSSTINDIVADGETSKLWQADSFSPVIVTHSKKIDYFYMINLEVDITSSNIHISYDNQQYANTTVNVKEEAGKKHWYTLEVVYNCEAYGGALLTYKMEVEVPGCGSAEFVWRKVCGYPQTPRDGFTIDMNYGNEKHNVVKNGLVVAGKFWDKDINDWAINIPADVDSATFDIYMNEQDIKQKQKDANNDTFSLFDSVLATTLETEIGSPKIDSDEAVARVAIAGPLVGKGGKVGDTKTTITMNFNCEAVKDYSTVEFVIPMSNFRDINLFFYKECDRASWSLMFWLIVILVAFLGYKTLSNIMQGRKGLDMLPYVSELTFILSWSWNSLNGLVHKKFSSNPAAGTQKESRSSSATTNTNGSYKNSKFDEESNEFNIKNMNEFSNVDDAFDENKYGTI